MGECLAGCPFCCFVSCEGKSDVVNTVVRVERGGSRDALS
jgi:hypothetical protein